MILENINISLFADDQDLKDKKKMSLVGAKDKNLIV